MGATAWDGQRRGSAVGVSLLVVVIAVVVWVGAMWAGVRMSVWQTPRPEPLIHAALAKKSPGPVLDKALATHGREIFEMSCVTCHGSNGLGKAGLGKDLVHSDFVLGQDDASLAAFVTRGRPADDPKNTTKVAMPPKGGIATLTDADVAAVVAYVRGLQDPRRLPELPALVVATSKPTETEKQQALAQAGGDVELAEILANGAKIYARTCSACHGGDAKGLPNLGKDLTASEFVGKNDDDALLAFLKKGRQPGEPGNTTGVAMPPKGGNPALSDDDLLDAITHLRSLRPGELARYMQKKD